MDRPSFLTPGQHQALHLNVRIERGRGSRVCGLYGPLMLGRVAADSHSEWVTAVTA